MAGSVQQLQAWTQEDFSADVLASDYQGTALCMVIGSLVDNITQATANHNLTLSPTIRICVAA